MKRISSWLGVACVLSLAASAAAQYQVDPRVDTRVGPVYPSKPYNFRSAPPGYDPYQFNWSSGRWDYVPIPYDQPPPGQAPSPYRFNWFTGQWDYRPWDAASPSPYATKKDSDSGASPAAKNSTTASDPRASKDDSPLWSAPTTQPADGDPPKPVSFQGTVVGMRAVDLAGAPRPELLLRLRDKDGKTATVDVGQRLRLPDSDNASPPPISVAGKSGEIDGSPVIFADRITIGQTTVNVTRDR